MNNGIRVYLSGGLGNQLYQYHFALLLKKISGLDVILDHSIYSTPFEKRKLLFDTYGVNCQLPCGQGLILFIYRKLCLKFGYTNDILTDADGLLNHRGKRHAVGYWQDVPLDAECIQNIRLSLTTPLKAALHQDIAMQIGKSDCCIHVRRGDYGQGKNKDIYVSLPNSYFQECFSQARSLLHVKTAYIFSDDIDWCKQNFEFDADVIFVDWTRSALEDFYLMMKFQTLIISNSTFSLWAAILSQEKTNVYCPSKWLKAKAWTPQYYKHWTRVDVNDQV